VADYRFRLIADSAVKNPKQVTDPLTTADFGLRYAFLLALFIVMAQFSPSDLCELLDLVKNDVASWTCEDVNSDVQLRPICEHMLSTCNAMRATLTDSLGESNTTDTENSGDDSVDEVRRIISKALYQLSD